MSDALVETWSEAGVGYVRLNRPSALNALSTPLMAAITEALDAFEGDASVKCIVLTGSERAFAAGADIQEMQPKTFSEAAEEDFLASWDRVARCRKPTIAAVSGVALGGGCEVAMMCDMIIAADNARFGQPEIKLGVMPGAGGTQRLTRAIGKAKAMDLVLTGRMMDAKEAESCGLVARVVPLASLMDEVKAAAQMIAGYSLPSLMAAKDAVNRAFESGLAEGVRYERRSFHALFASEDQKEGMAAFLEKRPAKFVDR